MIQAVLSKLQMGNIHSLPFSGKGLTSSANDENIARLNENNDKMSMSPVYWTVISAGGILAIYSLYKIVKILRNRHR